MSKMDVYCVVSLYGDSYSGTQQTNSKVVRGGGTHPTFNFPMRFNFDDSLVQQDLLSLGFKLASKRSLGDRNIGGVNVPIKELFDSADSNSVKLVSYQLRRASRRNKGELTFSYKFGDKVALPVPAAPKKVEPVMGYPVGGSSAPGYGYPRPPPPVQRVQKPPKKNKSGMGFGAVLLGVALLG